MRQPRDAWTTPAPYDMGPTFFAGEPIEDVRVDGRENRIVIRLETAGQRVRRSKGVAALGPVKDILYFDVDAYATARCVRAAATGSPTPRCHRTCLITDQGMARMRVGPMQPVRASLAPRAECYKNIYVVGKAARRRSRGERQSPAGAAGQLGVLGGLRGLRFGPQPAIPAPTFKVEFGETAARRAGSTWRSRTTWC